MQDLNLLGEISSIVLFFCRFEVFVLQVFKDKINAFVLRKLGL